MANYKILTKGILKYLDKYLIVEKWYDDRILDPYQWDFINGKVEFGENPDKAVLRILYENTGLSAEIDRILYTWTFMVGDVCNIGISYLCRTLYNDVLLSEDLHDYRWIDKDEFEQYITNQAVLEDVTSADI